MSFKTATTQARDALRWFNDSCPLPTEENRAARKTLQAAADAECETDVPEMAKTADWLERLAAEQEAKGKTFDAAENRERAAELRAKIATLADASGANDNALIGEAA